MNRLSIPGSTVAVTRLGFGCARLGGGWELRTSRRLIECALAHGIRHFDTAPMYGSEDVLGEVLAGVEDVTIATKVGIARGLDPSARSARARALYRSLVRPVLGRIPGLKFALTQIVRPRAFTSPGTVKRLLRRDEVVRELEESLRRLKRSRIDLYLLHEPEKLEFDEDIRELFAGLQAQGVIGAFGLGFGATPCDVGRDFGGVEQCRYEAGLAAVTPGKVRFFHGVLRHAEIPPAAAIRPAPAGERITRVLTANPRSAVIFSASSTYQIASIADCVARPRP